MGQQERNYKPIKFSYQASYYHLLHFQGYLCTAYNDRGRRYSSPTLTLKTLMLIESPLDGARVKTCCVRLQPIKQKNENVSADKENTSAVVFRDQKGQFNQSLVSLTL